MDASDVARRLGLCQMPRWRRMIAEEAAIASFLFWELEEVWDA